MFCWEICARPLKGLLGVLRIPLREMRCEGGRREEGREREEQYSVRDEPSRRLCQDQIGACEGTVPSILFFTGTHNPPSKDPSGNGEGAAESGRVGGNCEGGRGLQWAARNASGRTGKSPAVQG